MASPDSAVFLTLTQERRFCSRLLALIGGENINLATRCPIRLNMYDVIVTEVEKKTNNLRGAGQRQRGAPPRVDLLCQERSNIGCSKS